MKEQPRIKDLIKGVKFEGFLLVRSSASKTSAKTGGRYLDINFVDLSGEINAKIWDSTTELPKPGSVMKVRALVEEFNNRSQLRIDKIRPATDEDDVDMGQLVPSAPLPADAMLDEVLNRADAIRNKQLRELVLKRIDEVGNDKLQRFPAAKAMHHAEIGGLLHHTSTMLKGAELMCSIYPFLDADLLAAGVILHDLCKTEEFNCDDLGLVSEYSLSGNLIGHIVMGVSNIDRCGRELGTDRELLMMVEHMVLAHHGVPEYGSPRHPMFAEAEVLSMLDELDAKLFEIQVETRKVKPGSFTEMLRYLDDRKLYRRKADAEDSE